MSYVTYNNFKITLSESATIKLQLYVYSSYGTFNDLVLPYMICKNESELTTYEPYTGGQPSPSPEYPQEVTSVDKILATFKGNKSTLTKSLNHTLLKPLYRLSKNVYDYIDFNKGKIVRNIHQFHKHSKTFRRFRIYCRYKTFNRFSLQYNQSLIRYQFYR